MFTSPSHCIFNPVLVTLKLLNLDLLSPQLLLLSSKMEHYFLKGKKGHNSML